MRVACFQGLTFLLDNHHSHVRPIGCLRAMLPLAIVERLTDPSLASIFCVWRHPQPVLKKMLPALQPQIHDPSARVRRAFLDLLVAVKGGQPAPLRPVDRLGLLWMAPGLLLTALASRSVCRAQEHPLL